MSGICGICEPSRELDTRTLAPMLDALALPGESGSKMLAGPSITMGVARRWVFQNAAAFQQISVVADADLIDFSVPAVALSITTERAKSMLAAELIARLYLKYGLNLFEHLHGGFSVALWDEKSQRLCIAIDRIGIKTLYWRREGGRLLFASHAAAIRTAQTGPVEVNPSAVLQFVLFSSIPAPMSIDRAMEKLRPGTFVLFDGRTLAEKQYWDIEYPESENRSASHWARALREGMRTAVHRHLDGCEPSVTGSYLSGGTDSSSVVAFASEKHHPAQSFSIAFEEAGFSEIEFARTTAERCRTKHHEKFLTPTDATSALGKILSCYDEPFANSSAIGSYYCGVLAREAGVTTLLAGDGGDELFGGNERYATDKRFGIYHSVPNWLRRGVIEPFANLLPDNESKLSLPRRYIRRANISNPRRYLSYGFFLSLPAEEAFEDGFLDQVGRDNWLAIPDQHFSRAKATSELNRLLYLDLKMTLADNDLRKVSGTAELAGVNVRYPLLDHRLMELSGRIPAPLKLKGFQKRYIFKQAMKDILPSKVLYKKKHGFGVPLAQWLLQDQQMNQLMLDLVHDSKTRSRGYFKPKFFERLIALHKQQPGFYGEIVWYLLVLELWHRQHLDRSREAVHAI